MRDRLFEETVHFLMRRGETAFGLLTQRILTALSVEMTDTMAMIGLDGQGRIVLLVDKRIFPRLSLAVRAEIIKHELLHVVNGHLSARLSNLDKIYPRTVVQTASDIVVNQHVKTSIVDQELTLIWKELHPGVESFQSATCEVFNLEPDLTTEQYCRLLMMKTPPGKKSGKRKKRASDKGCGDPDADKLEQDEGPLEQSAATPLEDLFRSLKQAEAAGVSEETSGQLTAGIVAEIFSMVQDSADKLRGWQSGDAVEFIEQFRRTAEIPWQVHLRRAEATCRSTRRVPSIYRPSRRCPEHYGKKRRKDLFWWFCVDTSGSMRPDELQLVDAELRGISSRGAKIRVFHADVEIQKEELYNPRRGISNFHGRGGTDFSPMLLHLAGIKRAQRPSVLVLFTDGYGCLHNYMSALNIKRGRPVEGDKTPEGTRIIWLLTPNGMTPEQLRESIPIGTILKMKGAD